MSHTDRMFNRWIAARMTYQTLRTAKRRYDDALEEVCNLAGEILQLLNSGYPTPLWTFDQARDFIEWNSYTAHANFALPAKPAELKKEVDKTTKAVA